MIFSLFFSFFYVLTSLTPIFFFSTKKQSNYIKHMKYSSPFTKYKLYTAGLAQRHPKYRTPSKPYIFIKFIGK